MTKKGGKPIQFEKKKINSLVVKKMQKFFKGFGLL